MRTEHWIILFSAIFIAFFLLFAVHINLGNIEEKENLTIERDLFSACQAAMVPVSGQHEYIFKEKANRAIALADFYNSMEDNLAMHGYRAELVRYYVPCVFLVDTNGYYVGYTRVNKNSSGETEYVDVLTGLNTWGEQYDRFHVQFFLGDIVAVRGHVGIKTFQYTGKYTDAYEEACKFDSSASAALSFMRNKSEFKKMRDETILGIMTEQLNYYINTHNEFFNTDERKYRFTAPATDTDTVARLMDEPSVIGFAQGIQTSTKRGYINAYALAGTILDKIPRYWLGNITTGGESKLYYHVKDCPYANHNAFSGTMDNCAKRGADPCPYCIP